MRLFSGLRANVLANFVGRFSSMGLAIACTPLYIHFLGIEAYGLIGFYITLQASLAVLGMGLKPTCIKELAHHSARGEAGISAMRDTLRSLEVVYWCVALVIGVCLSFAAPWIAERWLNDTSFATARLEHVLLLVAWVIALRWPLGLYNGALMGLQRQVLLNVVIVALSVLNWGGSVLVLWLIQADIEHFFQWQLLVSIAMTATFGLVAWYSMPKNGMAGCFSISRIKAILPFAIGTGSNAVLGTILLQADKIILSAILPLKLFGYYALASVIAGAVVMAVDPIYNAVYPRLSQLVGGCASEEKIKEMYHLAAQAVSVFVIPVALVVAVFSRQVLVVYTGNPDLAAMASLPLTILVLAKMLHAMMYIPYALQLAYSWVKLSVYINIVSVLLIIPAVYFLSDAYGMVGAAISWLIVTLGYVFIGIPLMHRRLLVGEWGKWMMHAIILPVTAIGGILLTISWFAGHYLPVGRWEQGVALAGIGACAMLVATISSSLIRDRALNLILKRKVA